MIEDNLYNEENFKNTFLTNNFDDFLINNNNNLVNSNKYYLQFKVEYLNKTTNNLNKYTTLLKEFNELSNNYKINDNKYSYTFIDKNLYNKTNNELKSLLLEQRKLYNNFINYIQFLNSK
jgi:hypothetical protein